MLLYVDAVFALLSLLGLGIGSSAYVFLSPLLFDTPTTLDGLEHIQAAGSLIVFLSAMAYGFAGLALANGQRIGWKVGVGVAAGAVVLPLAAGGIGLVLGSTYVITYLFNVALLVTLLHPHSREHQKIWFE